MAETVVCCPDALSELLVSVDLDIYISQTTSDFEAKKQQGGTCYANASAAVLHLSMQRILGREGGYPDFHVLRDEIIRAYMEPMVLIPVKFCRKYAQGIVYIAKMSASRGRWKLSSRSVPW